MLELLLKRVTFCVRSCLRHRHDERTLQLDETSQLVLGGVTSRVGQRYRVPARVRVAVHAITEPDRIGRRPPAQPTRVVPRPEVVQSGLFVALLADVPVPLRADLGPVNDLAGSRAGPSRRPRWMMQVGPGPTASASPSVFLGAGGATGVRPTGRGPNQ